MLRIGHQDVACDVFAKNIKMIQYFYLLILNFIGLNLLAQTNKNNSINCYLEQDRDTSVSTFSQCEINPVFIGEGNESFLTFLLRNTDYQAIEKSFLKKNKYGSETYSFTDTAIVSFVTSKGNELGTKFKMTNLTVEGLKNKTIQKNLEYILKLSSCYWRPGLMSGRMVRSWGALKVVYTMNRDRKDHFGNDTGSLHIEYMVIGGKKK